LKEGDVIRKVNGQTIEDSGQLTAMVTNLNPGTEVTLEALRDGKPLTFKVKLGERAANLGARGGVGKAPSEGTLRGIAVQNLTASMRQQLGLPARTQGVMISDLDPNSPAAQAGLQPGDVIESINRRPVSSVADFNNLAAEAKGQVLLRINRQGEGVFVVISPGGDQGDDQ
jgi:serine protease Do